MGTWEVWVFGGGGVVGSWEGERVDAGAEERRGRRKERGRSVVGTTTIAAT